MHKVQKQLFMGKHLHAITGLEAVFLTPRLMLYSSWSRCTCCFFLSHPVMTNHSVDASIDLSTQLTLLSPQLILLRTRYLLEAIRQRTYSQQPGERSLAVISFDSEWHLWGDTDGESAARADSGGVRTVTAVERGG